MSLGTTEEKQNKTALIAMSGGVDSSVAACLLLREGYDCRGVTMRLYRNADIGLDQFRTCCSQRDIEDAAEVAYDLDIPFEVLDYTEKFKTQVMEKFIRVYEEGGTPNPCIDCNRFMKFDHLLEYAAANGIEYVATGHYARVEQENGRFLLKKGRDASKDQSYVLYMLTQRQLAHILFPLGELTKEQARRLAEENGFVNAHKHDSQDICFVPDGDYAAFMESYTGRKHVPGDFLDEEGRAVGQHRGAACYTLGQRKGLGLAMGEPVYVCGKNMAENTVTVGKEASLFHSHLIADELNWIPFDTPPEEMRVSVCTRYHAKEQTAVARILEDGRLQLDFDMPQRAMTPGQSVVLYDGDLVLGGGTIREVF
ncbi:MAG: tRNA 2-thiouridine(34) synthase MnmA [Lachnospiraceae bacterium]|nr:tRNA 2-thiouridine(34) synthase MnmA [Lachnospiraceae bacterium]